MIVHRAPIQTDSFDILQPEDTRARTRCGYLVPDAFHAYQVALTEAGPSASAKALHFAADIICSGGLDIWIRSTYNYCIKRVGLGNPRILVYLRDVIKKLDAKVAALPQEGFFSNPDVQSIIGETIFLLQLCPKKPAVAWPKVDDTTKLPGWLRGVASAPETKATRTIWSSDGDSTPLYLVSNELCKAVQEGSTERVLFWIRWAYEEDARIRKETKGPGLTRKERLMVGSAAQKTDVGLYFVGIFIELYKELAEKQLVRMHEEVGEIARLWKSGEKRMASSNKKDLLVLLATICCEVPRWKVPAAPPLTQDPARLARAVSQVPGFFQEVLAFKPLPVNSQLKPKMMTAPKKKKDVATKTSPMDDHLAAYEAAMDAYMNK
jgi:hypothetical protein